MVAMTQYFPCGRWSLTVPFTAVSSSIISVIRLTFKYLKGYNGKFGRNS